MSLIPAAPVPLHTRSGSPLMPGGCGRSDIGGSVIMKATLAIIILGASVLMAGGANAYRSNANGNQSYVNPDRETYVNRSCCSWKTNHAKAKRAAIKH
jgi:hypothetical protein